MKVTRIAALAILGIILEACGAPEPRLHDPTHSPDHCPLCHLYGLVKHGVVRIETPKGLGSGSIIDAKGMVVTNRHVVGDRKVVRLTLFDGRSFEGKVIRVGDVVDLALIELRDPPANLTVIPLGSTTDVEEGEEIFVIGHPLDLRWTISRGIVSRIRGKDDPSLPNVLQIDAPLSPGNSGGPVLTLKGRMVGVVTSKVTGFGAANLGFACPVEKVAEFLR